MVNYGPMSYVYSETQERGTVVKDDELSFNRVISE